MKALGLVVVGVVVAYLGTEYVERVTSRFVEHQHAPNKWHSVIGILGLVSAAVGFMLLIDYLVVRFPDRTDRVTPEQEVPAVLWEAGLALAVVGAALVAFAYRLAPAGRPASPPISTRNPLVLELIGLVLGGLVMFGCAAVTAAVAEDSELRWVPFAFAALPVLVGGFTLVRKLEGRDFP